MTIETRGQWRLFTQSDFKQTLRNWEPDDFVSIGLWDSTDNYPEGIAPEDHIHIHKRAFENTIGSLKYHTKKLQFEHGREGKIPRANKYRPYRLTLDGKLIAAIVFRTSEAFNLCEIDVFLTTEVRGLASLDATRAALLFAFSDAAKNAGSMAIQFTTSCAPRGVPPQVRVLAERSGIELKHADQGALSPTEVRELYLRLCGLSEPAQVCVREFAKRRFFSIERICFLVTQGLWPSLEAESALLTSSYPDLLLGAGIDPSSRHTTAQATAHARVSILSGIFDRALRYIQPSTNNDSFVEQNQYLQIKRHLNPNQLSVTHGPFPKKIQLQGWAPLDEAPLLFSAEDVVIALLRPRPREEIRVFLKHDLQEASIVVKENQKSKILLVYSDDYRQLTKDERVEADRTAKQYGLDIVACPESIAGLDAEFWRRLSVGRTVRQ